MLLKLRRDLHQTQEPVWQMGMKAWQFGMSHPLLYQLGGKAATLGSKALPSGGAEVSGLPYPLHGWTQYRDFPTFAPQSFREWFKANRPGKVE